MGHDKFKHSASALSDLLKQVYTHLKSQERLRVMAKNICEFDMIERDSREMDRFKNNAGLAVTKMQKREEGRILSATALSLGKLAFEMSCYNTRF